MKVFTVIQLYHIQSLAFKNQRTLSIRVSIYRLQLHLLLVGLHRQGKGLTPHHRFLTSVTLLKGERGESQAKRGKRLTVRAIVLMRYTLSLQGLKFTIGWNRQAVIKEVLRN